MRVVYLDSDRNKKRSRLPDSQSTNAIVGQSLGWGVDRLSAESTTTITRLSVDNQLNSDLIQATAHRLSVDISTEASESTNEPTFPLCTVLLMSWFHANLSKEIHYCKYFSLRFTATTIRNFFPDFVDIHF